MSAPIDEARLAEIEARANAATPGPWVRADYFGSHESFVSQGAEGATEYAPGDPTIALHALRDDATFIAAARTDVPALVAEVRRLTAALATARREGAEEMRVALIERFKERVKYLHPWAEAEDDENGCHSGAWTEALNAVQFTRDLVLPLDAPGGGS